MSFRLFRQSHTNLKVFEIDFDKIITHKAGILRSDHELRSILLSTTEETEESSSSTFVGYESRTDGDNSVHVFGDLTLIGSDLRTKEILLNMMKDAGVDSSLPTLVLT
jgi:ABC-type uncharacterized transport system fused permease/ATPase subunit